MKFSRKPFFDGYRKAFGSPKQEHVENLEFLLGKFEASAWFSADIRRAAFALGNLYIETFIPKTGSRFAPVTEFGSKTYFNRYDIQHNPRKARELGNLSPGDGYKYRGRGFCQITGKTNYAKFDIADTPEKALEPDTAFYVLERGIRYGIFTGRSLGTYINGDKTDYIQARRVINGVDRAKEIAGYARQFETILKVSAASANPSQPSDADTSGIANVEILAHESAIEPPNLAGTKEMKAEFTPEGGIKLESTEGPAAPKERIAVVKKKPKQWFAGIGAKITGLVMGNSVFQWVWAQLEKIQGLGIPFWVWIAVSTMVGVGSLIWIFTTIMENRKENSRQKELDELLVKENSTADNLVQLIPHDEAELYRAKHFKIITRGE